MAENHHEIIRKTKRWPRFGLQMSLRTWILLVAVIGVVVGTQYRRLVLTPSNVASLRTVARLDNNDIYKIAWNRDRNRLAIVRWEQPVEVRDGVSLRLRETIGAGKKIIDFAFSPRDDVVAYCENRTKNAKILDRQTGKTLTLDTKNDQPDVVFSPDGSMLATGGYGTLVRFWRVSDGELLKTFDAGPASGGLTPEFSPDGRWLAVGNRNSDTCVFEIATGALRSRLPKSSTQEIQFDPRSRVLAVTYVDGSLALWSVPDGKLIHQRQTTAQELYTVDWSPDGSMLATAGREGKITLWDPHDLSIIRELDAPDWVIRVKFSPDGLCLNFAGGVGTPGGKRRLEVLGIEGALFSLLHRPKR